jgi:hypothetical protein
MGQRHGRLVAIERAGHNRHGVILWKWKCDCGQEIDRVFQPIKEGRFVSCGCHRDQQSALRATHGKSGSRTYRAWIEMKARIGGKDESSRRHYRDRGITISERWSSFEAFLSDMGECPPGMSIERIDNNGNYQPGNCRWATQREQLANTRRTIRIDLNGEERCLKHACQETGANYDRVRARIRSGMPPQEAFDRG